MRARKRFMQTKQRPRRFYGISSGNIRALLSSLLIPLIFGALTIIMTFYQLKQADNHWNERMNFSRQQQLEDDIKSEKQFNQTWQIAMMNQDTQNQIAIDQYRNRVLLDYIKEISVLLKESNGSLTTNSLTHAVARFKTLAILQQLDGLRQKQIITFLYEAGQLTNTNKSNALDISAANLIDIHVNIPSTIMCRRGLSLRGVMLQNSTFRATFICNIDFSGAFFRNVSFLIYDKVDPGIGITRLTIRESNFSDTRLAQVNFSSVRIYNVTYSYAHTSNVVFSSTVLREVDFSSVNFIKVDFSYAALYDVTFSSARFIKNSISSFRQANMAHTIFVDCICSNVDFNYANLKNVSFSGATLHGTNFSFANLQKADFTNTNITDNQLRSALSIRGAKLPNGTLGQGHNLVKNGDANCNIILTEDWRIQYGNITVNTASNKSRNDCQFSLQSLITGAVMSQRIVLAQFWNSSIWTNSTVELQVDMSNGVLLELSGIISNGTILNKIIVTNSTNERISMNLHKDMDELEVVVSFNGHSNENASNKSIWCDNIELFIDYDVQNEKYGVRHNY